MRCPRCQADDARVVDSRSADDGAAIRRRRACESCAHRFTTFERLEERALLVRKRSGRRVPFDRRKIMAGLVAATKGRPVGYGVLEEIATEVEVEFRAVDGLVSTEQIGQAVLTRLRCHDQVAYLRFASVYKDFDGAADFVRELQMLEGEAEPA